MLRVVLRVATAIGVLLAGVVLIGIGLYLDRFNVMVQYDRWLERGMPD